jgi:CSLREA domain-containing protein
MRSLRRLLILLIVLLPAGPFATTFPVTKIADTSGNCVPNDCSLREAIEAANRKPGADDVSVPAGTYLLFLGQLAVSDAVSIAGAGQENTVIDGRAADRVINITHPAGVVAISGVTIRNGYASSPSSPYSQALGGGIRCWTGALTLTNSTVSDNTVAGNFSKGGGIYHNGDFALINSTVVDNTSSGSGGGISSSGKLTLTNSTVSGNSAIRSGGGILNEGGNTMLTNSTVSSNTSLGSAGGILITVGNVTLTNSTVSGNTALGGSGGGARFYSANDIALTNSTVSGNTAHGDGGGIDAYFYYGYGGLTLTNSTVSGNTSSYGNGGGIAVESFYYTTDARLTNSTVTRNRANRGGAGIHMRFADAVFIDTVVADNGAARPNCGGRPVDSRGHNLADDNSCELNAPGDLVVADAMLGPLANNGGPTDTHALLPGSPAIDAGRPGCPPPDTDQRGVVRPQGAACDIGSVEYLPEPHHAATMVAGAALLVLLYRRRARGLQLR